MEMEIENNIITLEQELRQHDIIQYLTLTKTQITLSKEHYISKTLHLANCYKNLFLLYIQRQGQSINKYSFKIFEKSIWNYRKVLKIDYNNQEAKYNLASIYTYICVALGNRFTECISLLEDVLVLIPDDSRLLYNLAFMYQNTNQVSKAITFYKLALVVFEIQKNIEGISKCQIVNNLVCVYRNLQMWNEALYLLNCTEKQFPDDPDINMQLGLVYTEMRRTDLAEIHFEKAKVYANQSTVTRNHTEFMSNILLNMGRMYSYNGDNLKSIDCYNKAIKVNPHYILPFQNKLMNLCYFVDNLESDYILKQHKLINKLTENRITREPKKVSYGSIGFVSGDIQYPHPICFFMDSIFKGLPKTIKVFMFTENITSKSYPNVNIVFTKGKSAKQVYDIITELNIDILVDLAVHTAMNRLDVFALKPCEIQVNFLGYPNTSGLDTMDYRITDSYCDIPDNQVYYTEKLLFMPNCFLCYSPDPDNIGLVDLIEKGRKELVIGCFNRLNKINEEYINLVVSILQNVKTRRY
jgi:predicted O-linked N-acetylglucosamine transferase (SPINDLY family)